MRWKAENVQAVFSSSHAVNQVLELVVDDMENEKQKRLTKNAAWKSSRTHDGDHRRLGGVTGLKHGMGAGPAGGSTCSLSTHLRGKSADMSDTDNRNDTHPGQAAQRWLQLSTRT